MSELEVVCEKRVGSSLITVLKGDITRVEVDAIVNPANSLMIMGGGVAYAIKKAGGEVIEEEARRHAPVPVGGAVATTGGRLRARYVIHAPTMERPAMRIGVDNVVKAVRAALSKALEVGVKSIAFPGMGTGVGGVPIDEAARAMVATITGFLREHGGLRVYLVGYTSDLAQAFCRALSGE